MDVMIFLILQSYTITFKIESQAPKYVRHSSISEILKCEEIAYYNLGNTANVMNYSLKASQVSDPQYVEEFY
jgi:hypothetical protein